MLIVDYWNVEGIENLVERKNLLGVLELVRKMEVREVKWGECLKD